MQTENKNRRKQEKYDKYEIPNISIIYRNDKNKNKKYRDGKRKRKVREIDVEENISDSDYSEKIDKYDLSPRNHSRLVLYFNFYS